MAWNAEQDWNGKKFGLLGWAKDVQLTLNAQQITELGSDLADVLEWFLQHHREIGLVEFWRETHYDKQFFEPGELQEILQSEFSSEADRAHILDDSLRRYERTSRVTLRKIKDRSGYVYLLCSNGVYKIGKAKKLDNRIAEISPLMPHPVTLIHAFKCDDYANMELGLHEKYAAKRLNGEWFALDQTDVAEIKAL